MKKFPVLRLIIMSKNLKSVVLILYQRADKTHSKTVQRRGCPA